MRRSGEAAWCYPDSRWSNEISLRAGEGSGAGDVGSYQRLGQRMQDITGDRGVLKEIIRNGSGETVPPDASVLVKFSGYLEHTDRPFDTNCFRKNPKLMKLGEDITLWGMEVGLLTMRKGELARFLFKPNYAFGTLGCPPLIPPNSTVLFEVELLDFLDSAESDKFFDLPPEQQDGFPLQKILKVAETERELGNYLFRQKHFMDARDRYKRASSVLNRVCAKEAEKDKVDAAKLLVFLNLSFVCLKLERPGRALTYGEKALELDKKNAKALFRCGQACLYLAEYERARDFLVKAQKQQPFNQDINNELKKLASCYRDYMVKEKEMCCKMFAPLNSHSSRADLEVQGKGEPAKKSSEPSILPIMLPLMFATWMNAGKCANLRVLIAFLLTLLGTMGEKSGLTVVPIENLAVRKKGTELKTEGKPFHDPYDGHLFLEVYMKELYFI